MQIKACLFINLFVSFILFDFGIASEKSPPTNDELETNTKKVLESYFKHLSKQSNLDFKVILSRGKYYDNGTVNQINSVAFSSKAENNTVPDDFDIGTISKKSMRKIITNGEDKGVLISIYQKKTINDTESSSDFETKPGMVADTAAASIVFRSDSFERGLQDQVRKAMDMTENLAIIQILEHFESGKIKRNITTTVHSNKVAVKGSYRMSARMIQESAETLKKAYKIDSDYRPQIIVELFGKKFPKYNWQVVTNSSDYFINKDIMVNLLVGQDSYHIIGLRN